MKRLFSILAFSLIAGVIMWAGPALASTSAGAVWETAFTKVTDAFQNSRKMIFIVGGFGLIVLAFFAIFGKIHWKWFAALCVGLAIVAVAGMVIDYVTTQ
jgi:type IV secretory pathway VirB2 component (pilin)